MHLPGVLESLRAGSAALGNIDLRSMYWGIIETCNTHPSPNPACSCPFLTAACAHRGLPQTSGTRPVNDLWASAMCVAYIYAVANQSATLSQSASSPTPHPHHHRHENALCRRA